MLIEIYLAYHDSFNQRTATRKSNSSSHLDSVVLTTLRSDHFWWRLPMHHQSFASLYFNIKPKTQRGREH